MKLWLYEGLKIVQKSQNFYISADEQCLWLPVGGQSYKRDKIYRTWQSQRA